MHYESIVQCFLNHSLKPKSELPFIFLGWPTTKVFYHYNVVAIVNQCDVDHHFAFYFFQALCCCMLIAVPAGGAGGAIAPPSFEDLGKIKIFRAVRRKYLGKTIVFRAAI